MSVAESSTSVITLSLSRASKISENVVSSMREYQTLLDYIGHNRIK